MSDHGASDGHGKAHKAHKAHNAHGGGHGHGGGGHEEHEGAPEWLISFADMVMLMMGFFVILFALNVQPKGGNAGGGGDQAEGVANQPDLIDFAIAVRRAFNNEVDINSTDPRDAALVQRLLEYQRQGAGESRDDGTRGKDRNVQSVRPRDFYGKGTMISFGHRATMLDPDASRVVQEFAGKHRGRNNVIEIRGHASAAEAFRKPEEAMTLAYDRAMNSARALAASGIDWWRLRVTACGDHERVEAYPGDAEADARNARVEILVTDEVAPPQAPTRPTGNWPGRGGDGAASGS
jgi:hypothetical protein